MSIDFKIFNKFSNLKYGASEKSDGAMKIVENKNNRENYFAKHTINNAISPVQSHSDRVFKVGELNNLTPECDALVTNLQDVYLTITAADCFPVYFYNPKNNILGVAHCGWRGSINDLIKNVVKAMGQKPSDIIVGIGPGLQKCHFEIQNDTLENFKDYPQALIRLKSKLFVDLPEVIISQLTQAGVPTKNIESFGECTFCKTKKYFSFRRDKPKLVQPMLAYIGIAKK